MSTGTQATPLPCPWCIKSATAESYDGATGAQWHVSCDDLTCPGCAEPFEKYARECEAIAAWNTRTPAEKDEGRICARLVSNGDNGPLDCDWPFCGCDPTADSVIEALTEMGLLREKVTPASEVERDGRFCAVVWDALKGDHTDLRRQAIILEAFRAFMTPARGNASPANEYERGYLDGESKWANIVAAMQSTLAECTAQFEFYEREHLRKGTPEGDAKAQRNREFADKCRIASNPDNVRS